MIVRHFSTSDGAGGAAVAAGLLHQALLAHGAESCLHVRERSHYLPRTMQVPPRVTSPWPDRFNRLFRLLATPAARFLPGLRELRPLQTFNLNRPPRVDLSSLLRLPQGDTVLVLHWMDGLLDIASIRLLANHFQGPIVWVIHDLEPFTGGCHYDLGCQRFRNQCGSCPQLGSTNPHDLSHQTWLLRKEILAPMPITFVAPTSWGIDRLRESSIFARHRAVTIPLPLRTGIFRPFPRHIARDLLRLPPDRPILLFGASYLDDSRKGGSYLIDALRQLPDSLRRQVLLLLVGLNPETLIPSLPVDFHYLGPLHDPTMMALAFQSADLFVCPSLADSGPMMIPESMLCATPVVAFSTGGAPDWIVHRSNGYLARLADPADLSAGIRFLLDVAASDLAPSLASAARDHVLPLHHPETVARAHLRLYESLLSI